MADDIDERLDRLTARHEALAESVELLAASVHELHETVHGLVTATEKLRATAEIHERRITNLENGEQSDS
jgi:prefoldin subunit 5